MRRIQQMVTATVLALVMMTGTGASATAEPDGGGLEERLDDLVSSSAVGASAEVRDEDGVRRLTSGRAELGGHRPVLPHSRFRAGSITKTFVATVILQLVDERRIRLDDSVEEWLPGSVPRGERITVRHLLAHTSGVYDYVSTLPLPPDPGFIDNRWRTWTPEELVERAVAHPPTSGRPGTEFNYSNTNYALLGQIIEEATGRGYATEIDRRILRPLRLHETTMPGTSPWISGPHLHGYVPTERGGEQRLHELSMMNPSVFGASGELVTTAHDLNRFFSALLHGRLMSDRRLEDMKTPDVASSPYGLGLFVHETSCGERVYGHDGDALAYQAASYATEDGSRQITVGFTPKHRGEPDDAVAALVDEAICG